MLAFRALLLEGGLSEALKWRQPCYMAHGENVALIAAERTRCSLSFFKGVLLDDPKALLDAPGPNSRSARVFRATSVDVIEQNGSALRDLIAQAVECARQGRTVPRDGAAPDLPEVLEAVLRDDPDFSTAFSALTPGRQRGWIIRFTQAKRPDTQRARIAEARAKVLQGQGPHDRPDQKR